MVSNASEDLPDPLRPVITVKVLRGISTLMFFRLCCRAPLTLMFVIPMRCFYRIPKDLGAPPLSPVFGDRVGRRWCPIRSLLLGKGGIKDPSHPGCLPAARGWESVRGYPPEFPKPIPDCASESK